MQLTNTSRTCTFSFYIYNNRYRQDIKIQPDNNNTGETEERGEKKQQSGSVIDGGHFIDELSYHFGFVCKWM